METRHISTITSEAELEAACREAMEGEAFHVHHHMDEDNGVPDVSFGYRNGDIIGDGWIEFKFQEGKLRASQVKWITDRVIAGGQVYILTKREREVVIWNVTGNQSAYWIDSNWQGYLVDYLRHQSPRVYQWSRITLLQSLQRFPEDLLQPLESSLLRNDPLLVNLEPNPSEPDEV